jgi:hypothetical protein
MTVILHIWKQYPPPPRHDDKELFFLVSWGGVGQSPLGTSATNWPTVPAPDDR